MLPTMPYIGRRSKQIIETFSGINFTDACGDGQLKGCRNMSSRRYPNLASARGDTAVYTGSGTEDIYLYGWNELVKVEQQNLYIGSRLVTRLTEGPKQFAVINNTLVVFPDMITVNLSTKVARSIAKELRSAGTVTWGDDCVRFHYYPWSEIMEEYGRITEEDGATPIVRKLRCYSKESAITFSNGEWSGAYSVKAAANVAVGDIVIPSKQYGLQCIWLDDNENSVDGLVQNTEGIIAKVLSATKETAADGSAYNHLKLIAYRIGTTQKAMEDLAAGDVISITQGNSYDKDCWLKIKEIQGDKVTFETVPDNWESIKSWSSICIKRKVPAMDFICASKNRIWGVSNADRTVYASALGNPNNWYDYSGISTDSYALPIASKGDFTGITGYSDAVILFKEDQLLRITGDYPAAYYLYDYDIPGVKAGCHMGCCIIGEVLYYVSRNGVYGLSGSTPSLVSYQLGKERLENAVAGTDGTRYYLSLHHESASCTYVYDTVHGIWYQLEEGIYTGYAWVGSTLYRAGGGKIFSVGTEPEAAWEAALADADLSETSRKQFRWLRIRYSMAQGHTMAVRLYLDGELASEKEITEAGNGIAILPIPANRADWIGVSLAGTGETVIKTVERIYTVGSEF